VEAIMLRVIKKTLLWAGGTVGTVALLFGALLVWPGPLFAYSLGTGKVVVASDRPIPAAGGERFLRDCERLLERSPLKAEAHQYKVYITNEAWRHRLFFIPSPNAWGLAYSLFRGPVFLSRINFETGRVVHWGYVGTPPRTPAWLCAHELTHVVVLQHVGGLARFRMPQWVFEGFADYVGIEDQQTFEQLRDAVGDRPVDIPMMIKYGSYPRYRLLVTYFLEKKGWSVDQLLQTRLTDDEANAIMRTYAKP
jgi:hypothetical protein